MSELETYIQFAKLFGGIIGLWLLNEIRRGLNERIQ